MLHGEAVRVAKARLKRRLWPTGSWIAQCPELHGKEQLCGAQEARILFEFLERGSPLSADRSKGPKCYYDTCPEETRPQEVEEIYYDTCPEETRPQEVEEIKPRE